MGPALAFFVLVMRPRALLSPRLILSCAGLFLLGLCLYAYLPIRAMAQPPLNWGDPRSWDAFWFHITRKQYRVIEMMRPLSVLGPQLKFFFASVAGESLPLVLLLPALLGAGFADRQGKLWLLFTVAAFFFMGVVFMAVANTELDLNAQDILKVYFLPAFILVALWLGYGIAMIGLLALRATRRLRLQFMPATAVAVLWLLLPAANLARNHEQAGMRRHDFARLYGETLLTRLEHGALLLTGTDSGYAVPMYLKWVRGQRPDVSILSINRLADQRYRAEAERNAPDLVLPDARDYEEAFATQAGAMGTGTGGIYGSQILTRVNGYLAWRLRQINPVPIYYDEGLPIEWVYDFAVPAGLVMELKSEPVEAIPADVLASDKDFWGTLEIKLLDNAAFLSDIDARQKFSKCRSNTGALYFHRKMYAEAEDALEQAIRLSDRNMEAYAYLALMRKEQGRQEEAVRAFDDYMRRDPWNTSAVGFARSLRQ
jgi:tetratricopeptide (TPR) repeat protein